MRAFVALCVRQARASRPARRALANHELCTFPRAWVLHLFKLCGLYMDGETLTQLTAALHSLRVHGC